MLVLSRKKNEYVTIGDNIKVMVVEIRSDKVRLGFDVPKEIPVHRSEIYDAIKHAQSEAQVSQSCVMPTRE
jgi:carbon storage regulator